MIERDRQWHRLGRLCRRLVLLLAASWILPSHGSDAIALLLSEPGGPYAEVAAEVRKSLRSTVTVLELPAGEGRDPEISRAKLVVAVGTHACRVAAQGEGAAPLLCLLIPASAYDGIARNVRNRAISALVLDQPVSRQMALIKAVVPERHDVAVLLGAESARLARILPRRAAEHGLRIISAPVTDSEDIPSALQSTLGEADVLLAVPDSTVYNSRTVQNILRTAFQARVPLIAFSPAYVKAGALAAVYTTPAQVGREGARWINLVLDGRPLPEAHGPGDFTVVVNVNVARALGISLEHEDAIVARIRKLEQAR